MIQMHFSLVSKEHTILPKHLLSPVETHFSVQTCVFGEKQQSIWHLQNVREILTDSLRSDIFEYIWKSVYFVDLDDSFPVAPLIQKVRVDTAENEASQALEWASTSSYGPLFQAEDHSAATSLQRSRSRQRAIDAERASVAWDKEYRYTEAVVPVHSLTGNGILGLRV